MTDYISREAAKKHIVSITTYDSENDIKKEVFEAFKRAKWLGGIWDAIRVLDDIPAADVRPVVTCKQCSLLCKDESKLKGTAPCSHWSNLEDAVCIYTNENDFCSYGISEVEE